MTTHCEDLRTGYNHNGRSITLVVTTILCLLTVAAADGPPVSHMEQQTPLAKLGVSGSNPSETVVSCGAGTLGAIVQDNKKAQYILSNAHVLVPLHEANPSDSKGDAVYHVGVLDTPPPNCTNARGSIVAEVAYGVAIDFTGNNRVDAALAKLVDDEKIVKTNGDILDIGAVGQPKATTNKLLGTRVKKSGRTSGLTFGTITSINDTQIVMYTERDDKGMLAQKPATFRGLITITPRFVRGKSPVAFFSGPGDSGSLIVTDDDKNQPIGLLFAGDGPFAAANRICDVLVELSTAAAADGLNFEFPAGPGECPKATPGFPPAAVPLYDQGDPNSPLDAATYHASVVKDRNENYLFSLPGVVGNGIGLSDNGGVVIHLFVTGSEATAPSTYPAMVEDVPVQLMPVAGPWIAGLATGASPF